MNSIPVYLACDGYKTSHKRQYNPKTEVVYSTWTPRKSRMENVDKVVFFGLQYFIKEWLIEGFNKTFFNQPKDDVINEFKRIMKYYTGDTDTSHWEALYDLGYLPLKIEAVEEGTLIPVRCPMFTIQNTLPEFYWLTNFIETIMSTEIWKPMTSATIALQYRKVLEKWSDKTCDTSEHLDYQAHDFSLRGMSGLDCGMSSGAGHLLSFKGTDTIPAILWLEKYYNANCENEVVGVSIPASEHSVQEANILYNNYNDRVVGEHANLSDFLSRVYPSGTFSYVADTYNLWECIKNVLPQLKEEILNRNGKVVIRPDSGNPCDIICGLNTTDVLVSEDENNPYAKERNKGVIELLWDIFGGTINSKGYKVLDPHIGCIYGDAITLERADEICRRLESKGFASSNIVFGIGSYTYNMNTRDTFGFALKTTYGVVDGKELMLYKDPITDSGEKKSQKGMVCVYKDIKGNIVYDDELDLAQKNKCNDLNMLQTVFLDGKLLRETSLHKIRQKLQEQNNKKENKAILEV